MDRQLRKDILRRIPYGLYVVGVGDGKTLSAFTANWLTQSSFDPPLVALAVKADGDSYRLLRDGGGFTVNFLPRDDGQAIAERFFKPARRVDNKLADVAFRQGQTGAPILEIAVAWFEAHVRHVVELGDHHVVLGEVVGGDQPSDEPALTLGDTPWSYGG